MKRYLPAMLVVAIAVAAIAILTNGGTALFATSHDDTDAPDSAPSVFDILYHFGPDFLCLIDDAEGSIECLGSDENGVISDVPTQSGFSEIAGGDTYACAHHADDDFGYCWGSLERTPAAEPTGEATVEPTVEATVTVEPTVESTVEPTPEATPPPTVQPTVEPTPPPPTVVPTVAPTPPPPTPTATATPVSDPCRLRFIGSLPVIIPGLWSEACVYPVDLGNSAAPGDRYYQYMAFRVNTNLPSLTANLRSVHDTILLLWEWDEAAGEYAFVEINDDISDTNKNSQITWTPTTGQRYLLDATTYTANTTGAFFLTVSSGTSTSQQNSEGQIEMLDAVPLERQR